MGADVSRWAIIGASSFSGKSFCRHLYSIGESFSPFSRASGFDLNGDLQYIVSVLRKEEPEYIVNFAALNMVAPSWDHFADYYQTNLIGVANLARAVADLPSLKRWVQVSTPEVYGDQHVSLTERSPYRPSTPYAVSRAALDLDLLALHRSFGFPVSFTRSVNVYGPGQQPYRLIPKTVLKILRGERLELHGGGRSTRSFIHIDDVSRSILSVAECGRAGEVYHTSTDTQTSIRDVVRMIAEQMGARFEDLVVDVEERPGKDMAYQLNSLKIRAELGWREFIPFAEGLRQTVEWFRANADAYGEDSLEYIHRR